MTPFKAPLDDILFSLRYVAQANAINERSVKDASASARDDAQDGDWDDDNAADILGHFGAFAEDVLAPLNATGDQEGAQLVDGRVQMPSGFKQAYSQLSNDGWQGLSAPEELGGSGVSKLIAAGVSEIFSGANHSLQMVCNLVPGAIATLRLFATAEQQAHWIPKLASGECLSTMCLTEAAAGSDLSAIKCRAAPVDDGWVINGEKIFISGGDQNLSKTILHLVLARSGGPGIKGLSLFLCASQPEISVTRIERKLGLHASPTCQMLFDNAKAELVGEEGAGLLAMFKLMNHARIDVALQGVAHASNAAYQAHHYAHERKQGRTSSGAAACLSDHADVQRMLDEQKILAIGARAICHIALKESLSNQRPALVEFLTSLCKLIGSEAGIRSADFGIQILGGYGYLTDYGMEQIWRDARITAIYEGANGIHERTLVTRGLQVGTAAEDFANLVSELSSNDSSIKERTVSWLNTVQRLRSSKDPTLDAHSFSNLTRELLQQAVWVRIAENAEYHPSGRDLARFSRRILGSVGVSVRWYAR